MIKQTYLLQKGGCQTWVKTLVAAAVSLSLIFTPLIRPPTAQAIYTSAVSGNTATLTGDSANDTIIIDVSGVNLQHNRFTAGDAGFNSNLDWDSIQLGDQTLPNTPDVTVNINAGTGNDTIILGTASSPASLLVVHFVVNGQGQTSSDTLIINNSTDASARNVILDSISITGIGGPITYNGIENLQITTGTGNDIINLGGPANSLDGLNTVTLNTGVGTDTLNFNDQGDTNDNTYTLSSSSLQRVVGVIVNYSNVDNLTLNGSPNDDQFNLQGASVPTTLKGDAGRDTFTFGNGVTLFGGTIEGGPGRDTLNYTAYTSTVSVDLALNTATGTGGISSIIDVIGGQGNDTLTGNPSANSLGGGPGDDTYRFLGGWGNDTINEGAGAGNDSLDFSAVTAALTITISSGFNTTTDGVNNATHNANEIENVISGSGNDTFAVDASALTSHSLSLDGGPHPTADRLYFNKAGLNIITSTTTITPAGRQPLFHIRIEQINIIDTRSLYLPIIRKQF
jgi:Ca2+-binding RTX toxin-like protein